jgi:hypothetical protein
VCGLYTAGCVAVYWGGGQVGEWRSVWIEYCWLCIGIFG